MLEQIGQAQKMPARGGLYGGSMTESDRCEMDRIDQEMTRIIIGIMRPLAQRQARRQHLADEMLKEWCEARERPLDPHPETF
ncbi:hypothetical protein PSQ20_21465 [Curvibacter sp. RS43]|uniref:hypothetical protein n=1 Tax=Curvibacter microcysteis TaxID=3026419 RepID=UPI00235F2FC7|nr:hypothetical protein [Curvibacter sp. RS43]MDD0812921.1 hypothetical protein [Curvibacter sp. RS43]